MCLSVSLGQFLSISFQQSICLCVLLAVSSQSLSDNSLSSGLVVKCSRSPLIYQENLSSSVVTFKIVKYQSLFMLQFLDECLECCLIHVTVCLITRVSQSLSIVRIGNCSILNQFVLFIFPHRHSFVLDTAYDSRLRHLNPVRKNPVTHSLVMCSSSDSI